MGKMVVAKLPQNISYSMKSGLKECELQFYLNNVANLPKGKTTECWGRAGNIPHGLLETKYDAPIDEIKKDFEEQWEKQGLYEKHLDQHDRPLPKQVYWDCVVKGLGKKYNIKEMEESFLFNDFYPIKGFVDVVSHWDSKENTEEELKIINSYNYEENGETKNKLYSKTSIKDWKTNSFIKLDEVTNIPEQVQQMKFYIYLNYRRYGKLPRMTTLIYLKLDKEIRLFPTMKHVHEVHEEIKELTSRLHNKTKFSDWKPMTKNRGEEFYCKHFCGQRELCKKLEQGRKVVEEPFTIEITKTGRVKLATEHSDFFNKIMKKNFTYQSVDEKTLFIMKRTPSVIRAKPFIASWDGKATIMKRGSLPMGALARLKKHIQQYSVATGRFCPIKILDNRKILPNVITLPKGKDAFNMRWYQDGAVDKALRSKMGIIHVVTSGGKTLIASEIYRKNPIKTLFVVDRKLLITQTIKEFSSQLGIPVEDFGIIGNGEITEPKNGVNITFGTIQTIQKRLKEKNKEMIDYVASVGQVMTDECHINKSKSYNVLFDKAINSHYRFGFSGSIDDEANNHLELIANVGDIIYEITAQDLIGEDTIMKPTITFLNYDEGTIRTGNFNDYKEQLFECKGRNDRIMEIIERHSGEVQLILVDRIAQGQLLQEMLTEKGYDNFFIQGSVSEKQREQILEDARNKHTRILLGTSSIVSKGLSIKPLSVVINTTSNFTSVTSIQSLGRVLRKEDGKNDAHFYDFNDTMKYFNEHTLERIKTFKKQGHEVLYD